MFSCKKRLHTGKSSKMPILYGSEPLIRGNGCQMVADPANYPVTHSDHTQVFVKLLLKCKNHIGIVPESFRLPKKLTSIGKTGGWGN